MSTILFKIVGGGKRANCKYSKNYGCFGGNPTNELSPDLCLLCCTGRGGDEEFGDADVNDLLA